MEDHMMLTSSADGGIITGTTTSTPIVSSSSLHSSSVDNNNDAEMEQKMRRKKIQEIMADPSLSQKDKSLSIQSLMDGRRRSSCTHSSVASSSGRGSQSGNNSISDEYNDDEQYHNSEPSDPYDNVMMTGTMGGSSHHNDTNGVATRYVNSMARAAAIAAEYYSSDDDADMTSDNSDDNDVDIPDDVAIGPSYLSYGYESSDHRSFSSEDDANEYYGYQIPSSPQKESQKQLFQQHNQPQLYGSLSNVNLGDNHLQQQQQQPSGTYRQMKGRSMSLQDWKDDDERDAAFALTLAASNVNSFINQLSSHNNANNAPNNAGSTTIHPKMVSRLMEISRPPCEHYERNCTIISFCCGLAFGCRICHDECPILPPPLSVQKERAAKKQKAAAAAAAAAAMNNRNMCLPVSTTPHPRHNNKDAPERRLSMPLDFNDDDDDDEYSAEETHHLIDRFAIREVICRQCYERQTSKTNQCIKCGIRFAEYHCSICNLWMQQQEMPYHCEQCGFCRVGGRENFTHCDDCGMCIDTQLFHDHNCKSGKYMSNCPICQEDLFSSRFASHEMPCGHAIHWHCFKELTSYDSRCPVCKKTAESPEQMHATWSAIAMGIALQPVPPEMARVVDIVCNDCESYDYNRRWHFLGVRCNHCLSFNTVVEQLILNGQEAADFLEELEARQGIAAAGATIPTSITASGIPSSFTAHNNVNNMNNNNINNMSFNQTIPNRFNTTPNHPLNNTANDDDDDMDVN